MASHIDKRVIEIVTEQMSVDQATIVRETAFVDDLHTDSLDTVELVIRLEREFALRIPDEDVPELQTVGDLIDYIAGRSDTG